MGLRVRRQGRQACSISPTPACPPARRPAAAALAVPTPLAEAAARPEGKAVGEAIVQARQQAVAS